MHIGLGWATQQGDGSRRTQRAPSPWQAVEVSARPLPHAFHPEPNLIAVLFFLIAPCELYIGSE